MKYEMETIRKPMVQERVEVNLLKYAHCYLKRVTTRYLQYFQNNINTYFFINLTITHGNALQIAPNHAKLSEKVCYHV